MPIDFPNSPTNGQTFTSGDKTWEFDGTSWVLVTSTASIGTGAIATVNIADNAITTAKIAAGAVVEVDIATDAVTTNKIANNAVTAAKLATTAAIQPTIVDAKGDLIVGTGADTVARQGVGANGTVLMADSAQTNGIAWSEQSLGYRNVVINGAMQVAQRGTSKTSITTSNYYTADRWRVNISSLGTWTQSVENDAPTGSGLRKSLKMLCTTADAAPAAGDVVFIQQRFEGQNVQQFLKGTASAKSFMLTFWVKSNVTGTFIAEIADIDNTRQVSKSYTISASGTWEKKTIDFGADTTGAFDNDNAGSLFLNFHMGAGTDYTSGTLNTSWATTVTVNRAVGQTNLAAATNNYFQITGVQLEAGSVATPFEFEDYGTTLAKCRRYYYRQRPGSAFGAYGVIAYATSTAADFILNNKGMRTDVVTLEYANVAVVRPGIATYAVTTMYIAHSGIDTSYLTMGGFTSGASQGDAGLLVNDNNAAGYIAVSAEL